MVDRRISHKWDPYLKERQKQFEEEKRKKENNKKRRPEGGKEMKESFLKLGTFLVDALVPAMMLCSGIKIWVKGEGFWCLFGYFMAVIGVIDIYASVDKRKKAIARDVDISKREIAQLFKLIESQEGDYHDAE